MSHSWLSHGRVGTKGRPLQDVPLWQADHFEPKIMQAQKALEDTLTPTHNCQESIETKEQIAMQ